MHDEITNYDRAHWAVTALDAFGAHTGQVGYDYDDPEHLGEIAGDLIGNLLHLAAAAGLATDALIEQGRGHFEDEQADEDNAAATGHRS